jgi:hypothetical protein
MGGITTVRPSVTDVFALLRTKPAYPVVYIIGAGPNGKAAIHKIPPDATTVVLNSAILYDRPISYWLAFDCAIRQYPWWATLKVPPTTQNVFGITLVDEHLPTPECQSGRIVPHYSFRFRPTLSPQFAIERRIKRKTDPLIDGILRGGASIAGAALQFAAWTGTKRIVLCGVDMFSNTHFDGFVNQRMQANAEWPICAKINWLCGALKQFRGIEIVSLSKTSIKIPVVDHV